MHRPRLVIVKHLLACDVQLIPDMWHQSDAVIEILELQLVWSAMLLGLNLIKFLIAH